MDSNFLVKELKEQHDGKGCSEPLKALLEVLRAAYDMFMKSGLKMSRNVTVKTHHKALRDE